MPTLSDWLILCLRHILDVKLAHMGVAGRRQQGQQAVGLAGTEQGHAGHCRCPHRRPEPGRRLSGIPARSLPGESAVCYTDYWEAYRQVVPEDCHVAAGKDSGLTNHIGRFNNTLRQRVSRLARETLSFSKKLENHIGTIWYFIHHYNALRLAF